MPNTFTPGYRWSFNIEDHPEYQQALQQRLRGAARTAGGGLGLFLGDGGREKATGLVEKALSPVRWFLSKMGWSPYEGGEKRLRRGLSSLLPGPVDPGTYGQIHRALLTGPFESQEGVLRPAAGGLNFPDRARVFQQAAARGYLPRAGRGALRPTLNQLAHLNRAAATLQQMQGGDVGKNLNQIFESGLLDKMPAAYIAPYLRRLQIEQQMKR